MQCPVPPNCHFSTSSAGKFCLTPVNAMDPQLRGDTYKVKVIQILNLTACHSEPSFSVGHVFTSKIGPWQIPIWVTTVSQMQVQTRQTVPLVVLLAPSAGIPLKQVHPAPDTSAQNALGNSMLQQGRRVQVPFLGRQSWLLFKSNALPETSLCQTYPWSP